jgi:hypothetical protein
LHDRLLGITDRVGQRRRELDDALVLAIDPPAPVEDRAGRLDVAVLERAEAAIQIGEEPIAARGAAGGTATGTARRAARAAAARARARAMLA